MHYETPIWEEGHNNCPQGTVCGCAGSLVTKHDPPLIFDLEYVSSLANWSHQLGGITL